MWKLPAFSSLKIQCFLPSFSVEKVFFLLLKLIAPAALIYIPFASFKDVIASLFLFWIFKRSSICFPLHILLYSMQTVLSNQNHLLLAKPKGHFQVWFCMKFDPCWSLLPLLKSPFFFLFFMTISASAYFPAASVTNSMQYPSSDLPHSNISFKSFSR